MPALVLGDETLAAPERIHAGQLLENALTYLPAEQAQAVTARIVDERDYDDIARELLRTNSVRAWSAPHRDGVCLIVRVRGREARRCRAKVSSTEPPLIVAVRGGGSGRVVAAAFQDRITRFNLVPEAGIDRATKTYGAMIWADGGERRTLRYSMFEGTHRVAIPGYSTTRPSSP